MRIYTDEALAAAHASDQRRARGATTVLDGIPIGVKDIFAIAGHPLTASSRVLEGNITAKDSVAVARLRRAGAVLVGHTHTHEFANGSSTDQVGNPYNPSLSAGGSSGGSAAAVALRMVPGALGSDTGGSLRTPAALCGISTIKPTHGLIPTAGVIPLAPSRDTVGPLATSIADCSILLQAMADGPSEATPIMPPPARLGALPITARDTTKPLKGLRVALTDRAQHADLHPDIAEGYVTAQRAVLALGATLAELRAPATLLDQDDLDMFLYPEAWVYHQQYYPAQADKYRPQVRSTIERASQPVNASQYLRSQERRAREVELWDSWLLENSIDVVLEPTLHYVAPPRGDGYKSGSNSGTLATFSLPRQWNLVGYPVASLPVGLGLTSKLPVAVSLIASRGQEQKLVQIAIEVQERFFPIPRPGNA